MASAKKPHLEAAVELAQLDLLIAKSNFQAAREYAIQLLRTTRYNASGPIMNEIYARLEKANEKEKEANMRAKPIHVSSFQQRLEKLAMEKPYTNPPPTQFFEADEIKRMKALAGIDHLNNTDMAPKKQYDGDKELQHMMSLLKKAQSGSPDVYIKKPSVKPTRIVPAYEKHNEKIAKWKIGLLFGVVALGLVIFIIENIVK